MKIIQGQQYRYCPRGEIRSHRGLVGVANNVASLSAVTYSCILSNIAEWEKLGIATQITALSFELEPAEEVKPLRALQHSADEPFQGLESDLVQDIIAALAEQGYMVCVVGQLHAKGSGTTIGYPDLSVRRRSWPDGMACLLEVKTRDGQLSGEQEELLKLGWSYMVRSVQGATSSLTRFENEVFAK